MTAPPAPARHDPRWARPVRGEIHCFIGGGGFGGGSSGSRQIAAWVQQNFTAMRVSNATVYDLTMER
ncbi:MAG: hypothetical protein ACRDSH_04850 [Pseudonocardiaceae bacterium]